MLLSPSRRAMALGGLVQGAVGDSFPVGIPGASNYIPGGELCLVFQQALGLRLGIVPPAHRAPAAVLIRTKAGKAVHTEFVHHGSTSQCRRKSPQYFCEREVHSKIRYTFLLFYHIPHKKTSLPRQAEVRKSKISTEKAPFCIKVWRKTFLATGRSFLLLLCAWINFYIFHPFSLFTFCLLS